MTVLQLRLMDSSEVSANHAGMLCSVPAEKVDRCEREVRRCARQPPMSALQAMAQEFGEIMLRGWSRTSLHRPCCAMCSSCF